MIRKFRHIILLFSIYGILLSGGLLLIHFTGFEIGQIQYFSLLTVMTFITLSAYILIQLGIRRGEKEQGIFLLAGLGAKFLAYLILILIYWASGKNLSKEFIITFFVLYLLLTFFLLGVLFKALKTN
jgi:hypothetical protein